MKKAAALSVIALVVIVTVIAITGVGINSGAYHLREFEKVKTNFNNYVPTLFDRCKGIWNNQGKWNYHLGKLEQLGIVQHQIFTFTNVPYTKESSRRIWRSAYSNFSNAVMCRSDWYDTNNPGYGVKPYVLEVWDFPTQMPRWSAFFETNNYPVKPVGPQSGGK